MSLKPLVIVTSSDEIGSEHYVSKLTEEDIKIGRSLSFETKLRPYNFKLVLGDHGCGKTTFIKQIVPQDINYQEIFIDSDHPDFPSLKMDEKLFCFHFKFSNNAWDSCEFWDQIFGIFYFGYFVRDQKNPLFLPTNFPHYDYTDDSPPPNDDLYHEGPINENIFQNNLIIFEKSIITGKWDGSYDLNQFPFPLDNRCACILKENTNFSNEQEISNEKYNWDNCQTQSLDNKQLDISIYSTKNQKIPFLIIPYPTDNPMFSYIISFLRYSSNLPNHQDILSIFQKK